MPRYSDAPRCPKELELKGLIQFFESAYEICSPSNVDEQAEADNYLATAEALRYLDNLLQNRKGYQRKQQIKRKLLWKAADEMGLMKEIDDAARARLGEEFEGLERETEDDDATFEG